MQLNEEVGLTSNALIVCHAEAGCIVYILPYTHIGTVFKPIYKVMLDILSHSILMVYGSSIYPTMWIYIYMN